MEKVPFRCTKPGNPYSSGRIGTVDLHELTSLDQLLFKLKLYISFFYKTTYLNEEVNRTKPSPAVRLS